MSDHLDDLQRIAEDLREYGLSETAEHIAAHVDALRQRPPLAESVLRKAFNAGDDEYWAVGDDWATLDLKVRGLTEDEAAYLRSLSEEA